MFCPSTRVPGAGDTAASLCDSAAGTLRTNAFADCISHFSQTFSFKKSLKLLRARGTQLSVIFWKPGTLHDLRNWMTTLMTRRREHWSRLLETR